MRFRHAGVQVGDMDQAVAWYEGLGGTLLTDTEEVWYGKKLRVVKFREGLELVSSAMQWPQHVCLELDEFPVGFDGIDAEVRDGYLVKFVHDPWGNRVELVVRDA